MDNDVKIYVDYTEPSGPCPVCGGTNWKTPSFKVCSNVGGRQVELPIISHAIICGDCGLIRINPRLLREMREEKRLRKIQEKKKEDIPVELDNNSGITMM